MSLITPVGFLTAGCQDAGEEFWRFKPGTTWTYDVCEGEKKGKLVLKAIRYEGNTLLLSSENLQEGKSTSACADLAWYMCDGFVIWGRWSKGKAVPKQVNYRIGIAKGDTWEWTRGTSGRFGVDRTWALPKLRFLPVHTRRPFTFGFQSPRRKT